MSGAEAAALAERIEALSPDHKAILMEINPEYWAGYTRIANHTALPLTTVKKLVREMHRLDLLEYGHLSHEDDSLLAGKGYWFATGVWQVAETLREGREAAYYVGLFALELAFVIAGGRE